MYRFRFTIGGLFQWVAGIAVVLAGLTLLFSQDSSWAVAVAFVAVAGIGVQLFAAAAYWLFVAWARIGNRLSSGRWLARAERDADIRLHLDDPQ